MMFKLALPTIFALLLIACEAPATHNDSSTQQPDVSDISDELNETENDAMNALEDNSQVLSDRPIPQRNLERLNQLLRKNMANRLEVQFLYCTDSHWAKSAKKNKPDTRDTAYQGPKQTYEEAGAKCETFASTLSQCLATQGFNISAAGLKKDDGYIKYFRKKYKDSHVINTDRFLNRSVMNFPAKCDFDHCGTEGRSITSINNSEECKAKRAKKPNPE